MHSPNVHCDWLVEPRVDRRLRAACLIPKAIALLDRPLVQEQIVLVQDERHVPLRLGLVAPGDVVEVRVREHDVAHGDAHSTDNGDQLFDLVAGVDDDGVAGREDATT